MIDYHTHLDLYPDPLKVFNEVEIRGMDVLAVTTSPRAYLKTSQHFPKTGKVRIALGFHPELVAQRQNEWELFLHTVKTCRYIGEIGIDGSKRFCSSLDAQMSFFKMALIETEMNGGHILSVHSRVAENKVLSAIEHTIKLNRPVLHWFIGTKKEIDWAVELGCWFSINPQMCTNRRGRESISRIPLSRMLPETDGPFVMFENKQCYPWDSTVSKYIASLYNVTTEYILDIFNRNLEKLESNS